METGHLESPNEDWPRYFLRIAYDGTCYHGWQRQPNGNSVQAEVEKALRILLRQEKVVTTGCGRTDTGVHARVFYLHFNAENEIDHPEEISRKLNRLLPKDIAAYELTRVGNRAHSRFDAVRRGYAYYLHRNPDPFLVNRSMWYPWPIDVGAMQEAAKLLAVKEILQVSARAEALRRRQSARCCTPDGRNTAISLSFALRLTGSCETWCARLSARCSMRGEVKSRPVAWQKLSPVSPAPSPVKA
jgi:tRNA pseudouridine(38-40) synthase